MGNTPEEDDSSGLHQIVDMQLGKCRYVRIGDNITYVGVGVVLRDNDGVLEVLLVQEAKKRCYGKWYIPSGRIENGETIEEGLCREVLEESGYKCEVEELLCLQVQGSGWYRFAFYCNIIGGERKTVADAESLSSNWFPIEDVRARKIETRGTDFFKILDDALRYRSWRANSTQSLRQFLPIPSPVSGLFIEFLIIRHAKTKSELLVHHHINDCEQLINNSTDAFPLAEFGFQYFFAMVVSKCFQHMLEDGRSIIEIPKTITQIQCTAKTPNGLQHGLRVRLVCVQKWSSTHAEIRDTHRYHWIEVSEQLLSQLHLANHQYRPTLYML